MMGGMTRFGVRRAPQTAAKATPELLGRTAKGEKSEPAVRRIGSKTFYFKDKRWLDAEVTPEEDAQAKVVRQFSDAFFALARSQGSELNQYLTFDEPVTVKLDSVVYRIEPADERP